MKGSVLVAMSGGVDSAVTAYLLKEAGYEVIGATFRLGMEDAKSTVYPRALHEENIENCRKVAEKLKIPYYVFNLDNEFKKEVIEYFMDEYLQGRTPNPCVVCNARIKWGYFFRKAEELGLDYFATGHYAKVTYDGRKKRFILKEAEDKEKDQSYFLFMLGQEELAKTLLPLGEYKKAEVRKLAKKLGLFISEKTESQDACFIPRDNKNDFFLKNFPEIKPGFILNKEGEILGKHKGIIFYTIGQREGLGIAWRRPLYVIRIDAKNNTLIVGEREEIFRNRLRAKDLNWVSIDRPKEKLRVEARIRHRHLKASATVYPSEDNSVEVIFDVPQFAITPGQAIVFYKNSIVLGGGWID